VVANGSDLVVRKGLKWVGVDGQYVQIGCKQVVGYGRLVSDGLGLLPRKLDGCKLPKGRVALGKGNGGVKLCLDWVGHWLRACDGVVDRSLQECSRLKIQTY
jgi:hypothetical protein